LNRFSIKGLGNIKQCIYRKSRIPDRDECHPSSSSRILKTDIRHRRNETPKIVYKSDHVSDPSYRTNYAYTDLLYSRGFKRI